MIDGRRPLHWFIYFDFAACDGRAKISLAHATRRRLDDLAARDTPYYSRHYAQ